MDDAWGSPWADVSKVLEPPITPAKVLKSPWDDVAEQQAWNEGETLDDNRRKFSASVWDRDSGHRPPAAAYRPQKSPSIFNEPWTFPGVNIPSATPLSGPNSSRPTSSPSEHAEDTTESARTSFEGEPLPETEAESAAQLVNKDEVDRDGESLAVTVKSGADARKLSTSGITDEFGDFAEGDQEFQIADGSTATWDQGAPVHEPSLNVAKTVAGDLDFSIDFSLLDKLFPDQVQSDAEPAEQPDIRRYSIHDSEDSFTTPQERKAWYRVSRYGSMRKHDSGEDENYRPINWAQSTIRDDTLKTVSRWREEDRSKGHVTFGSGESIQSAFGWGNSDNMKRSSVASTVSASLSLKRSSVDRAPGSQKVRGHENKPSLGSSVAPVLDKQSSPSLPPIHFGWSHADAPASDVPARMPSPIAPPESFSSRPLYLEANQVSANEQKPATNFPSRIFHERSSSAPVNVLTIRKPDETRHLEPIKPDLPSPQVSNPGQVSQPLEPVEPTSDKIYPIQSVPTSVQEANGQIDEDDDDEWGEMISSPATPVAPSLPSPPPFLPTSPLKPQPLSLAPPPSNISSIPALQPQHSRSISLPLTIPAPLPAPIQPPTRPQSTLITGFTPPPQSPSSSPSHDPWASADFSFFDSLAPTQGPTQGPSKLSTPPIQGPTTPSAPPSKPAYAKHTPSKSIIGIPVRVQEMAFQEKQQVKEKARPKSVGPTDVLRYQQKRVVESEQERVARQILGTLPDLGYMFR